MAGSAATAVNRLGASPHGHLPRGRAADAGDGRASLAHCSGLLIGPTTTVFYDSGFLIGLAALWPPSWAGWPATLPRWWGHVRRSGRSLWPVLGQRLQGGEDFAVFTLILPILLWRPLTDKHVGEDH